MIVASARSGRKRHILVDTLGLLLAVVVTKASVSDPAGAKLLLSHLKGFCKKLRRIWVDGAYRGQLLEWVLLHFKFVLQPVLRSDDQKGFVVLPGSLNAEGSVSIMKSFPRRAKR
jgi:putative transposase